VDLDVDEGEAVGIIGEKGCGKSTLLLCAAGLLRGDSGSIHWYGKPFKGGGHLPNLVYVPAVPTYYPFLTVRDVLSRNARPENRHFAFARTIDDVSHCVSLTGKLGASVRELGTAELKLLGIAQAMMSGPKVIVLDGTLDALDDSLSVVSRALGEEATKGATLIVASR
jgi:ABC-type multidrug transport system ATPase subunit